MSLALAAWLMVAVGFLAYHFGRRKGRAEVAALAAAHFAPILPALEQLIEQAESIGALHSEQAEALRGMATWN